jgi:Uma2 family endonuclease
MRTDVTKKLFTVDEYYKMAEVGIFDEDSRVELIEGEIIEMSPPGNRHIACVNRATELFVTKLGRRVIVSPQNPVRLSNMTEPQPDLVVLKPRPDYYETKRLSAEDTFLVIEISDTSLRYDRNRKLLLYAKYGVPEVWIEDLQHNVILVYRDPDAKSYATCLELRPGESISMLAFPHVLFTVTSLLGI